MISRDTENCYVGLGQIRVPGCEEERIQVLLDPIMNLKASAFIQHGAMHWCTLHVCPHGWLYLYNPSKKYGREVRALAKETRRAYTAAQPVVRKVRGGLLVRRPTG